jgi:hypothetical protein
MNKSKAITINFEYAMTIAIGFTIISGMLVFAQTGIDQRRENAQSAEMESIAQQTATTIYSMEDHIKSVKREGVKEYKQKVKIPGVMQNGQQIVTLTSSGGSSIVKVSSTNPKITTEKTIELPNSVSVSETTSASTEDVWVVYDRSEDEYYVSGKE